MDGYWRALFVFLWTETKSRSIKMQKKERGYNRRQNELRHFAQNWAFGGDRGRGADSFVLRSYSI